MPRCCIDMTLSLSLFESVRGTMETSGNLLWQCDYDGSHQWNGNRGKQKL